MPEDTSSVGFSFLILEYFRGLADSGVLGTYSKLIGLLIGPSQELRVKRSVWSAVFFADPSNEELTASLKEMDASLPGDLKANFGAKVERFLGLECVGILEGRLDPHEASPSAQLSGKYSILQDDLVASPPILISCTVDDLINGSVDDFEGSLDGKKTSFIVESPGVQAVGSLTLRLRVSDQLIFEGGKESDFIENVTAATERLGGSVFGAASVFQPKGSDFLFGIDSELDSSMTCATLLQGPGQTVDKKKMKTTHFTSDGLEIIGLQLMTGPKQCDKVLNSSPVVHADKKRLKTVRVPLSLETYTICFSETPVKSVTSLIRRSGLRQLELMKIAMKRHASYPSTLPTIDIITFMPSIPHFLTIAYPSGLDEAKLESERKRLHLFWNLPLDRPFLKPSLRFLFPEERGPYLRNVHTAVGPSSVGGEVWIIEGDYQYHHYMQEGFNDKGWGCAYRSFQTIWSWFLLQGYTDKPVPSHKEIQEALVAVGDKERTFIGSSQWVGSLELSFCLTEMLGITSRIATASTGEEMAEKARELSLHFETEGTPVMIGGGVLAHTILGIDFDEATGNAQFLILDPHYTGEENLKTIIEKGWCGWKPVSFWKKDAFYNMLLPQRPKCI